MRLLRLETDGELSLAEFVGNNIPPYAIFSHTWGVHYEEITFGDICNGTGKSKAGYAKIRFCGKQAANDYLQYFWVDTCCIDKTSSVELSEAVNSMFRWYRNATKCYVYLSDVSVNRSVRNDPSFQQEWKIAFRQSRWFTRGWTLQELIAPRSVEFFSREWKYLGDKNSLEQEIHDITGIPVQALQGSPLAQFSIDERMSWAAKRATIREEEAAYSLLGIFDIHMPLIYGEGRESAFKRLLKEIREAEKEIGVEEAGLSFDHEKREDLLLTDINHTSTTNKIKTETDEIPDTDSEPGSDAASIFSDGGISTSSASSVSLNPVQTTGIREISRALLSHEDLRALYTTAVRNIEQRKVRVHIRGFLKEYGRNLRKEASNKSLEIQAAKFVQELAGRIADEISWSINGFQEMSRSLETEVAKKDLETWLLSLQPQSVDIEEELNPLGLATSVGEVFEEAESDEELDSNLLFPNIDKVKDFLLNSEAFGSHVIAMRNWLKVDGPDSRGLGKPGRNMPVSIDPEEATEKSPMASAASEIDRQQKKCGGKPTAEVKIDSQQDTHDPKSTMRSRQNRDRVSDLSCSLLDFWGIAFFFYDLVELLVPVVRPGYKRLRWRCSCNTVLWGDFPIDNDSALSQLKRELSWWRMPFTQQASLGGTSLSQPNAESGAGGPGTIHLAQMQSTGPSSGLMGMRSAGLSSQNPTNVLDPVRSRAAHIVNVTFSPRYFEVCINIGNYAIDHHEIDISRVTSDGELFELIWDKYNCSRGFGLRRLFLRPRDVHFVMFSVSRRTKYGTGIHKKPNEFPPQKELDKNRYHYLCPKIRMPVNVFLHYLHRARWNIWGGHSGLQSGIWVGSPHS
ncbi:heterokaryon incompatibility protein-domain-containing protein [Pyrenochaeta sp. MPI-SDFR-AT-0127]|nr:heterokaryon incompatibility protein-domain-containing protein [Pyrenochaeta sp. MPI-SDFR-AT-0127]